MAEGVVQEGKTLKELEMEITCSVCQKHYTEPKVLPCLHYYCKECIQKLCTRTASNTTFSCPECRKDTTFPKGGVEELKTAFFINRLKSNFSALERVHGKIEVTCEGCNSRSKAEAFCRHCAVFICKDCVASHKKLKAFSSHEVASLEDLKQGRVEEMAVAEPATKKCSIHEEPLLIYCFDCNSLICRDCTVIDHREHKFQFSKVAAPEPVEEVDMGVEVRCGEALQQLCQTKAKIAKLALDPAQCTVRGEGAETAEVHQQAQVTLTTRLFNSKTTSRSTVVVSELKSLYDGSVIKCNVDQSGPGEYRIQYTPTVRGRHELTVSVDGQQVAGSPFPVFVSISPTQLGKPVKVWSDINEPRGITTNSENNVIVAEDEENIIMLNTSGKNRVLVKHTRCKLKELESVATDSEDNIYCTDHSSNKVMKCNKNGSNVQVYKVQQVAGPGHYGVAVIGDEVMLCERGNEGTIMIYDRELKYKRHIEHVDGGEFQGMSADIHGNLYVSDRNNHCIRVFSNDGVLLRSFGYDSNGVKRLHRPYGVCVSSQYVYVTNCVYHNVSVFTTGGDYVTSFGQKGNNEGDFNCPICVRVDTDGFIYVADCANHRIQCF